MSETPTCHDSTTVIKNHLVFSIDRSDYHKEIRIVETPEDRHPRICLIDNQEHSKRNIVFIEVTSDAVFEQIWEALKPLTVTINIPVVPTFSEQNTEAKK